MLLRQLILALGLLGLAQSGSSQCLNPDTARVAFELEHPALEGQSVVLRLSDYYPSGAAIGTAQAVVNGTHVAVIQTNEVAPTLPTITCRVQLLNIGQLSVGNYSAVWTTTEHISIPYESTNTRVRTLAFTVSPASAVPVLGRGLLLLLMGTLALTAGLALPRT